MELVPINGCVLVELTGELKFVEMPDKQYATNTTGIVRAVHEPSWEHLIGKRVYFEGFKEVEVIKDEGKFAFVKAEDLRGYEQIKPED